MAYSVAKVLSPSSHTDVESLKRPPSRTVEGEKQRLLKAARDFESMLTYEMLKVMRKSVSDGASDATTLFSGGLGKDTFEQIFDIELAHKMAAGGRGSVADMLYKALEPSIEAQFNPKNVVIQSKSLDPSQHRPVALPLREDEVALPPSQPIPIQRREKKPVPLRSSEKGLSSDPIRQRFGRYIDEAARRTSLDSSLIHAVIKAESGGDPQAVSPAGAKGLMQLADTTAEDYGVSRVFDPRENILAGSRYLKRLLDRFGDMKLALAAYNAGPQTVARHGGVPPFAETKAYVEKVTDLAGSHDHTARDSKERAPSDR
ncbi:MAG TPA: transglycosylase SLT domain-containing protein [Candidatus Deferrimicrobium sp.]|nr:transglycosylase SLT domain-containing protein [Candidatus Deferrimicrobium sp.]